MIFSPSKLLSFLSGLAGQGGDVDRPPEVPAGRRLYVIGDIHGRADLLMTLRRQIREDAEGRGAARNVVIHIGDYVDRGEESHRVLDMLLDDPLPDFESIHLLGNHEKSLLQFLADASIGPYWVRYGGDATLYSFGVRPPAASASAAEFERARQLFASNFPSRYRSFLETLSCAHEEGDYLFVHAGIRPGIPLDRQSPDDLLWIREDFLFSNASHGRVVVHGHSISDQPEVRHNRIGIDTGAFASGHLTCLVLEGAERRFLQT
ncbi:metallophosphoesterase [Telmatospirillum siberiense]|uniref:Serine/threonine protein phosphatase n=1 Tax=Telmatospirillum siberiense TaxID=382514 RepID=A0A2N3PVP0_9PROT|nr:metallophosphoesterase [Telmatospirillum siberiense]PKU24469.1 serine/threonine protein phosphatase [Telmatospirillum siberiense]